MWRIPIDFWSKLLIVIIFVITATVVKEIIIFIAQNDIISKRLVSRYQRQWFASVFRYGVKCQFKCTIITIDLDIYSSSWSRRRLNEVFMFRITVYFIKSNLLYFSFFFFLRRLIDYIICDLSRNFWPSTASVTRSSSSIMYSMTYVMIIIILVVAILLLFCFRLAFFRSGRFQS